tara:strand:- start:366 stop:587 length:222 start_codon:yes stop_codon:yes gene_type:complete
MMALMNQPEIPDSNLSCKNCTYADQYSKIVFSANSSQKEFTKGTLPLFLEGNIVKIIQTKSSNELIVCADVIS